MGGLTGDVMPRFDGLGLCVKCGVPCTAMNYLVHEGKKYCTGCWVEDKNPTHPELDGIKETVSTAVTEWKCLKWYREDRKLPNGPYSYKK